MKKKAFLSVLIIVIVIAMGYGVGKLGYRAYNKVKNQGTEIAALYELQAMGQHSTLDSLPHNIICLGNSITHHATNEELGWHSDWGMAASVPEKDYCHQLESMLREKNDSTRVTPLNIAFWERNLNCNLDSLLGDKLIDKDIIVIRLGENVQDTELFSSKIIDLINLCKRQTPNVVITGCFWQDAEKEKSIIKAAHLTEIKYTPLYWIDKNYRDIAHPKSTDIIKDTVGKEYTLTNKGVLAHPGDEAMKMIAESIYNCL